MRRLKRIMVVIVGLLVVLASVVYWGSEARLREWRCASIATRPTCRVHCLKKA